MSSELQSIATGIVDNNYVTRTQIDAAHFSVDLTYVLVVILTAVGYDYSE